MMISAAQINALDMQILDRYSRELALRLAADVPEWTQHGSDDSRQRQVSAMLRYGRELKITDTEDLYRLTFAIVRYDLKIPLRPELLFELKQPGLTRAAQIENLMLRLLSNRDGKITVRL